jgi:hypothetical protein
MAKPRILFQLDSDALASSFDAVVAFDSGVDQLLPYHGVTADQVTGLVHGAIFTRGPQDLHQTAIYVGGTSVSTGVQLLQAVTGSFFGPMRVSVMLDANGANTTAAAAVLAAARHVDLAASTVLVIAATGSVGQRVLRLLARQGAIVRAASRSQERAERVCQEVLSGNEQAQLIACPWDGQEHLAALAGVDAIIAAGAAGVQLISLPEIAHAGVRVAIDLNAVPPLGVAGIEVQDKATERSGTVCYGAVGVGGTKMKIHKEAVRRLFTANDLVLDAEEIFQVGLELES